MFPFLNSSLAGWRSYYCDSADGWRTCARYQQALRGQYVPLSLLPNGRDAHHLQNVGAGADGPVAQLGNGASGGPTLVDLLFEHAPAPAPTPPIDEAPVHTPPVPHPRSPESGASPLAPRPALRERRSAPRWWKRFMEWMRTPA